MAAKKKTEEIIENEETQVELAEANETPEAVAAENAEIAAEDADTGELEASEESEEEKKTTKAGKRSAKAIREAEEEAARLDAKEERATEEEAPKVVVRSEPNPLKQHGKKYREAAKLVDRNVYYDLADGIELALKTATTKFDSSLEVHVNLGVDPRQADQMVRASVVLPHGTGKSLRIAVFADGKAADEAKAAGADLVGTDTLIKSIEAGKLDFDILIATPDKMAALGKAAKVLGPRGLMPNPKSGTVTPDVAKAVKEAKAGKIEFRLDKQAIVHQAVGKVSFKADKLAENINTFLAAIMKAKPSASKGTYVKAISLTTSMGPGIKIDASKTIATISTK